MAEQLIIIQTGPNGGHTAEAVFPPSEEEATRYLEALIARGVDPGTLRVYRATEAAIQITQRPVVSLGTQDGTVVTSAPAEPATNDEAVPKFLNKYHNADGE
jgi:hypothetical protein